MEYKYFGVLIECCNAVMKVEEVKTLIDRLAKMGYNLLEICANETYKIEDEPYFGYLQGGYTKSELQEIDAHARMRGVELVPCIQTLGHFADLVKLPHYADIVDLNDILLIDEPKTYQLIEKMFKTLRECYSTELINIGFDEAHMAGLGRYLYLHGYVDRFELLLKHLNKVVKIAEKYRFKPHMWSDMFFRLANNGNYYGKNIKIPDKVKSQVPENIELAYWDYYATEEDHYEEMFATHKEFQRTLWFAGGAWTWNGFAPINGLTLKTMLPAMKQVRKQKIENVIITLWADDGHECSYNSVLPSLYAIRKYADGVFDDKLISKEFEEIFGVSYDKFMLLDIPNKTSLNPNTDMIRNACKSLLYNDCFLGWKDSAVEAEDHIPYGEYATLLKNTAKQMGEFHYLFDNLANLCSVLELKAELGVHTRKAYQSNDRAKLLKLTDDYLLAAERLQIFHKSLRDIWMKENKPYAWEIHEVRLGGLYSRLLNCRNRILDYLNNNVEIPELMEKILPYADWGMQYNKYTGLISVKSI